VSSISVCLSVYVQRAALTTPPPFGRTLSCQDSLRAFQAWTPPPRQARVPFHKSFLVALGVGRVGAPSGQACTASSGQT
jgi:hypothetical protein